MNKCKTAYYSSKESGFKKQYFASRLSLPISLSFLLSFSPRILFSCSQSSPVAALPLVRAVNGGDWTLDLEQEKAAPFCYLLEGVHSCG